MALRLLHYADIETAYDDPERIGRLAGLIARRQVVFVARSKAATNGRPHTRLRLEGELLRFGRAVQRVEVPGAGRMLVEDHRTRDEPSETQGREPASEASVNFAGRGQTLFTWEGGLTLDAARNGMLLERNVWMIHRPTAGDTTTLDCDRLLAELSGSGGLGMRLDEAEPAPDPELKRLQADRDVILQQGGRTILADHLDYRADRQQVRLWAEGDGLVQLQSRDQPGPLRAGVIEWHLATDRIEARDVAGGMAPVPR